MKWTETKTIMTAEVLQQNVGVRLSKNECLYARTEHISGFSLDNFHWLTVPRTGNHYRIRLTTSAEQPGGWFN
jgi:hypothetical protein